MLVPIGLIIAFIIVAIVARKGMRACRWRETRDGQGQSDWVCVQCGATMQGPSGVPPKHCLRPKG
ncbi:hypothetical protein [Roseivivax sp. CAU 1753]